MNKCFPVVKGSNKNVALAFSRRQGNPSNDAGRWQGVCPSQGQMKPQKGLIVHCQQSTLPGWSRKSAIHVCTSSVLPGQPHIRPEYSVQVLHRIQAYYSRLDSLVGDNRPRSPWGEHVSIPMLGVEAREGTASRVWKHR